MGHRDALEENKRHMEEYVRTQGVQAAGDLLENTGFPPSDWHRIVVDSRMRTNIPGVYAAGDCCGYVSLIDGRSAGGKLATNAVPMAKVAASVVAGRDDEYPGFVNGAATCVYDLRVGSTGFTEEVARERGVKSVVFSSSDKAVNPINLYGATKLVMEKIFIAANSYVGQKKTAFSVVRYGNVVGSAGSVVELFQKQIRNGQPVTVTHPDIERFFMTIPEAVHLVLHSATLGQGGETFILDMGKQVKVAQLARQIIRLSGLTPEVDVPIIYTGLRPGEKLYEELWTAEEQPVPTDHPGILQAPGQDALPEHLVPRVEALLAAAWDNDLDACWLALLALVPTFQGRTNGSAVIPPDQQAESSAS